MSRYKPYPQYKGSGVEWLGEVPTEWKIKRYKHVLQIFQGSAFKSSDYIEYSNVINLRMGNIKKGGKIDLQHNLKYLPSEYLSKYSEYILQEGDVVIAMTDMSPSLEFLAIPAIIENIENDKTYLLNQRVGKLIFDKIINSSYIKYTLLSSELRNYFKLSGLGTVQANMSNDNLYEAYLGLPSLPDQIKIANFLDNATCKIDTLIQKQQNLIELLKEKRQALISHAVTKGLNPHVKMKDSGVEWLGEVPVHWEVMKIKHMLEIPITDGPHETPEFIDEGVPFVSAEAISSSYIDFNKIRGYISREANEIYSKKYSPKLHDIYMVKSGATTGVTAIVNDRIDFNIWSPLAVFRCSQKALPNFLLNYLRSKNFFKAIELHWSFGTQQNIGMNVLENLFICLPAIQEQQEISNYLDNATCKIDTLITKAQKAIELLKERRTALISATVTGKIDVREIA